LNPRPQSVSLVEQVSKYRQKAKAVQIPPAPCFFYAFS
jgi:hypothetical protein